MIELAVFMVFIAMGAFVFISVIKGVSRKFFIINQVWTLLILVAFGWMIFGPIRDEISALNESSGFFEIIVLLAALLGFEIFWVMTARDFLLQVTGWGRKAEGDIQDDQKKLWKFYDVLLLNDTKKLEGFLSPCFSRTLVGTVFMILSGSLVFIFWIKEGLIALQMDSPTFLYFASASVSALIVAWVGVNVLRIFYNK